MQANLMDNKTLCSRWGGKKKLYASYLPLILCWCVLGKGKTPSKLAWFISQQTNVSRKSHHSKLDCKVSKSTTNSRWQTWFISQNGNLPLIEETWQMLQKPYLTVPLILHVSIMKNRYHQLTIDERCFRPRWCLQLWIQVLDQTLKPRLKWWNPALIL